MPNYQQHFASLAGTWQHFAAKYYRHVPAVTLRLFAAAREAAATDRVELEVADVAAALAWACDAYGDQFAAVLETSRVWLNGQAVEGTMAVEAGDEIAVLPPVSGGA